MGLDDDIQRPQAEALSAETLQELQTWGHNRLEELTQSPYYTGPQDVDELFAAAGQTHKSRTGRDMIGMKQQTSDADLPNNIIVKYFGGLIGDQRRRDVFEHALTAFGSLQGLNDPLNLWHRFGVNTPASHAPAFFAQLEEFASRGEGMRVLQVGAQHRHSIWQMEQMLGRLDSDFTLTAFDIHPVLREFPEMHIGYPFRAQEQQGNLVDGLRRGEHNVIFVENTLSHLLGSPLAPATIEESKLALNNLADAIAGNELGMSIVIDKPDAINQLSQRLQQAGVPESSMWVKHKVQGEKPYTKAAAAQSFVNGAYLYAWLGDHTQIQPPGQVIENDFIYNLQHPGTGEGTSVLIVGV